MGCLTNCYGTNDPHSLVVLLWGLEQGNSPAKDVQEIFHDVLLIDQQPLFGPREFVELGVLPNESGQPLKFCIKLVLLVDNSLLVREEHLRSWLPFM
jgi:hypothetical protein